MMSAATAVWFTGPRQVELRPQMLAPPGPDEVLLRARVSALSQGTELLVYRGEVPPDLPLDLPTLAGSFAFPIKYGYALVAEVVATGSAVSDRHPGDLVFVLHPHQSATVVPAALTTLLPAGLDPELGVFTANLETALNVLHDAPLLFGETAVVFGLGTVGLLVALLLQRAGAGRVVGIDPVPLRRELARRAGLAHALAPDAGLLPLIRDWTDGRGADVAIEASGSGAALQAAIDAVAVEGTVVVASWYGTKPVSLTLGGTFHRGRVRLRSSQVGRLNPEAAPRWDYARRTRTVTALLPQLALAPLITHRFPLTAAAEAYRLVDEQPGAVGQVLLTYPESEGV
jgi:2-desacetyl-2-hydroxyethyl bacteriochlorophyllide A dehydrogenase